MAGRRPSLALSVQKVVVAGARAVMTRQSLKCASGARTQQYRTQHVAAQDRNAQSPCTKPSCLTYKKPCPCPCPCPWPPSLARTHASSMK